MTGTDAAGREARAREENKSMATATLKRIDDEVLNALASIEWNGNAAVLTCGQLDRKVYEKTSKVLESLGGKWNRKAKAHLFDAAAQDELEAVIENRGYVDRKQDLGFFETPDDLADEVVRLAEIENGMLCLEPSAGTGQLIRAARRAAPQSSFMAIEIDERHREALGDMAVVIIRDFISMNVIREFECGVCRILMNPPHGGNQRDIDHVLHAWQFLKPGGRLVAITSLGWTFRTNRKSVEFREFVEANGWWQPAPEGAFKESGTMARTCIVLLDKEAN